MTKPQNTELWKALKALDMIYTVLGMRAKGDPVDWDVFWDCMDELLNQKDGGE